MATRTITIPNESVPEVLEAFELVHPCPDIKMAPADWVNQCVGDFIKNTVLRARKIKAQASVSKVSDSITVN